MILCHPSPAPKAFRARLVHTFPETKTWETTRWRLFNRIWIDNKLVCIQVAANHCVLVFSDFTKMIFSNCKTDHPPTSFCLLFYSVFRRVIIQIYDIFQKFNYQSYTDCCFYLFFLMLSRFYIAAQLVRMIYLNV